MEGVFRAACRTQVTKLCNSVSDYLKTFENIEFSDVSCPDTVMADIVNYITRLKNAHANLSKADEAFQCHVKPEDMTKECESVIEYDDKAATVIGQLEHILQFQIKPLRSGSYSQSRNSPPNKEFSGVKLKPFELRKFDGHLENWLPFWEQFKEAVHENGNLSTAAKFNFLSSALVGKAAAAIAGFSPTERCYNEAVNLLEEEYGNNEKIVEKYMQKLMNLKAVQSHDSKGLRNLYNEVAATMRSFVALQVSPTEYDLTVRSVLLKAIPTNMRIEYYRTVSKKSSSISMESTNNESSEGHVKVLLDFLKVELEAMEKAQLSERDRKHEDSHQKRPSINTAASLFTTANSEVECIFCKKSNHTAKSCSSNMSMEQKKAVLKREGRCFRCANKNHTSKFCKAQWLKCTKCGGRHLSAMCERASTHEADAAFKRNDRNEDKKSGGSERQNAAAASTATLNTVNNRSSEIYLQTAKAVISKFSDSERVCARLIMDNGSQQTYISEKFANELELETCGTEKMNIVVFGENKKSQRAVEYKCVEVTIRSQYSEKCITISAIVVPTICADVLPLPKIPPNRFNHVQSKLAENQFCSDRLVNGINLLIGQDYYWHFNTNENELISENLVAVNTFFGWTVQGCAIENSKIKYVLNVLEVTDQSFYVSKFWKLEAIGISSCRKREQENALEKIVARQDDGRYVVSLPWLNEIELNLNDNKKVAFGRLKSLCMKLQRNKNELSNYDAGIRDLLECGIAEIAPMSTNNRTYYMPHRPVYRDSSSTTKLRIVFDASSSEPGLSSLNDLLSVGENIIADLLRTLIKFRSHKIAMVADIEKAFLQISLAENDRDVHRFLWYESLPERADETPNIVEFRMTRVTFGVASSPFLLAATINKHLETCNAGYKDTAEMLKNDDLVLSVPDREAAYRTFQQANEIMSSARFNLRKWNTNDLQVKARFPASKSAMEVSQKVLGTNWCTMTDEIGADVAGIAEYVQKLRCTKRNVMKAMAKIYDPLGVLGPFTVRVKVLLQSIWVAKSDWDESLSGDTLSEFQAWQDELPLLCGFTIKRALSTCTNSQHELHIFADASPKAYGAVAYIREIRPDGSVFTTFICSKNRVRPIDKTNANDELTLPKLELTAALIAARLKVFIIDALDVKIRAVNLWTDSMITLNWINGQGKKNKPYVKARVTEINDLSNIYEWRHCEGRTNPADLLTRGVKATVLMKSDLWKFGPSWLCDGHAGWDTVTEGTTNLLTVAKDEVVQGKEEDSVLQITDYSSIKRLLRVTAFIFRFITNTKRSSSSPRKIRKISEVHELAFFELKAAEEYWIKHTQATYFSEEIQALMKNGSVQRNSKILTLNPILSNGMLRLRGRLPSTHFGKSSNPVILPKHSHFSKLIVNEAHKVTLHGGISAVLCQVRKKYWILQGRQLIKTILQHCVICRRLHGKCASEPWTNLPVERIHTTQPFETTGVDFAGPLYVVADGGQSQRKVYIMLFTCAAIRAVHLELVGNMTVTSCIQALRRFVARRGAPSTIISDNARTFKRANLELDKLETLLKRTEVQQLAAHQDITWKYIPERAAWWGGFWERMVRTVKNALKAAVGKAKLSMEELSTFLTEVEAVVNARPLTYITNDHNDPEPLTPSHFLSNKKTLIFQESFRSDGSSLSDL